MSHYRYLVVPLFILACVSGASAASIGEPGRGDKGPNLLKNVSFGEQHLHTQDSPDAFSMGTRNTQDDAFNFRKGKAIKKITRGQKGITVRKKTPYDWCAVTDHALLMGLLPLTLDSSNPLSKTEIAKLIEIGTPENMDRVFGIMMGVLQKGRPPAGFDNKDLQRSAWANQIKITNKHNDPGKFTTLIAVEWSSIPYRQNLHRNVFYSDDVGPGIVFSTLDSDRPEDLWTYLETQRGVGHEVFAIPHNSNVSNSHMFSPVNSYATPINVDWIRRRAKNEVAVEILQTKGTSDTHPARSPNGEFADFESGFKPMPGARLALTDFVHARPGPRHQADFVSRPAQLLVRIRKMEPRSRLRAGGAQVPPPLLRHSVSRKCPCVTV